MTSNYYIPQWEERTSYGMRRVDPYTKLFEDRIIFLGTPISDDIANREEHSTLWHPVFLFC